MKFTSYLSLYFIVILSFACKKNGPDRQPDTSYNPTISKANFSNSTNLTNSYFPYAAGKKYVYEGQTPDGLERIEEQRLATTKTIMGITCVIVNFKEWIDGKLVEETWDWYAQDNDGTVWYFGEAVDNYNSQGTIKNHEGSWEAGVDDAKPGIIMPANPSVGMKYREEYYFNHAEDEAEIIGTSLTVSIPFGTFNNCIQTRNFTMLEPDQIENKFYAPGIGLVKEINLTDNNAEIRLIAIQ